MKFLITFFIGFCSLWLGANEITKDTKTDWITCFTEEYSYSCVEEFKKTFSIPPNCPVFSKCKELNLNYVMVIEEKSHEETTFYFPSQDEDKAWSVSCKNRKIKKGRHCSISEELQLR